MPRSLLSPFGASRKSRRLSPTSATAPDALRNLGPRSMAMLAGAGIGSVMEIRRLGAVGVFRRVKAHNPRASLNLLWALAAGLDNRHWQDLGPEEKSRLPLELDARNDALKRFGR